MPKIDTGLTPVALVVDDELLIAEALREALEAEGFHVLVAATGTEALKLIDSESVALAALVTDIRLGEELNGWDVARHAREVHPLLPVVYISGDSVDAHSAYGVPDSVMLQKPFLNVQLVTALATLMNAAQQPPSAA